MCVSYLDSCRGRVYRNGGALCLCLGGSLTIINADVVQHGDDEGQERVVPEQAYYLGQALCGDHSLPVLVCNVVPCIS